MLNAMLSTLPLYYMSFFMLPRWVIQKLDRIRRPFLWNGVEESMSKYHLVPWDQVCKPWEDGRGGLGGIDLKTFNTALMAKRWWWRLLTKDKGSLQRLICSKYGPLKGTWHNNTRNRSHTSSSFWRGILVSRHIVWQSLEYRLGNGCDIAFWHERWCSKLPLKVLFPGLLDSVINKEATVSDYLGRSR